MSRKRKSDRQPAASRWYRGKDVPMRVIRRFARDVGQRFKPQRIVLFGSYAYGRPHADSDVDILVVMTARDPLDQAAKIHTAIMPPFPVDILVQSPEDVKWRLAEGDAFLGEIMAKGKVLYEKVDGPVGAQGGRRLAKRQNHKGEKQAARS
jgi:predicted nucleotidyltransferase